MMVGPRQTGKGSPAAIYCSFMMDSSSSSSSSRIEKKKFITIEFAAFREDEPNSNKNTQTLTNTTLCPPFLTCTCVPAHLRNESN